MKTTCGVEKVWLYIYTAPPSAPTTAHWPPSQPESGAGLFPKSHNGFCALVVHQVEKVDIQSPCQKASPKYSKVTPCEDSPWLTKSATRQEMTVSQEVLSQHSKVTWHRLEWLHGDLTQAGGRLRVVWNSPCLGWRPNQSLRHIWGRKHVNILYKVAQEEAKQHEGCPPEKSVSATSVLRLQAFLKLKRPSEMMPRLRRGGEKTELWKRGTEKIENGRRVKILFQPAWWRVAGQIPQGLKVRQFQFGQDKTNLE